MKHRVPISFGIPISRPSQEPQFHEFKVIESTGSEYAQIMKRQIEDARRELSWKNKTDQKGELTRAVEQILKGVSTEREILERIFSIFRPYVPDGEWAQAEERFPRTFVVPGYSFLLDPSKVKNPKRAEDIQDILEDPEREIMMMHMGIAQIAVLGYYEMTALMVELLKNREISERLGMRFYMGESFLAREKYGEVGVCPVAIGLGSEEERLIGINLKYGEVESGIWKYELFSDQMCRVMRTFEAVAEAIYRELVEKDAKIDDKKIQNAAKLAQRQLSEESRILDRERAVQNMEFISEQIKKGLIREGFEQKEAQNRANQLKNELIKTIE